MKDLIDKRNEKEKLDRSVIKRWNVNYVRENPKPECSQEAKEVLERLAREAESDEEAKQLEIEKAKQMAQQAQEQNIYNRTTGSYSGMYGNADYSDVTKGQIDKILHERTEAIRNIVENGGKVPEGHGTPEEGTK